MFEDLQFRTQIIGLSPSTTRRPSHHWLFYRGGPRTQTPNPFRSRCWPYRFLSFVIFESRFPVIRTLDWTGGIKYNVERGDGYDRRWRGVKGNGPQELEKRKRTPKEDVRPLRTLTGESYYKNLHNLFLCILMFSSINITLCQWFTHKEITMLKLFVNDLHTKK